MSRSCLSLAHWTTAMFVSRSTISFSRKYTPYIDLCGIFSVVRQRNKREDEGNIYRTVVRPTMVYEAETRALKKAGGYRSEVADMRILRWMCGVRRLDKIRNERIRGTAEVGEIPDKVQKRRLTWYGHVMRREEHYVGRRVMEIKVQG